MTDEQKLQIANLRSAGLGYKKIAERMGLSENTVKTYCRRHGLGGNRARDDVAGMETCRYCGKKVDQKTGRKKKKFCTDKCRNEWWNSHLEQVNRKAFYRFECLTCKKEFTAYGNSKRKYCCLECYAKRSVWRNKDGE